VEIEPGPERAPRAVPDADREAAAELLQRACGAGRLSLEEFSERVGAAWAADTWEQLAATTAGIEPAPPVGTVHTVSTVVNILGQAERVGRWRLPRHLRVVSVLGQAYLDLRDVVVTDEVIDIRIFSLVGEVVIEVPEGVEADLLGFSVLGERSLRLAPVTRRLGTPHLRVHAYGLLGEISVRSRPPGRAS
jgi:hypothetical protein